jgi:phytoene synthase
MIQLPATEQLWRYFRDNSRSFSFATSLVSRRDRQLVAQVYSFCRVTDDLVDAPHGLTEEESEARLTKWLQLSRGAYDGTASGVPWLDAIMTLSSARGVPFTLIEELIDGVRRDIRWTGVTTLADLDEYSHGVASVVGLWLCRLFFVTDPVLLDRAASLGRAMQITNILRDVGEDLDRNRIYLPEHLMSLFRITSDDLHRMRRSGTPSSEYRVLVETLAATADEYYRLAWEAIPLLPPAFGRLSAVGATTYQAILGCVRRNGYNNFTVRARTSGTRKVFAALAGLLRLYYRRLMVRLGRNRPTGTSRLDRPEGAVGS